MCFLFTLFLASFAVFVISGFIASMVTASKEEVATSVLNVVQSSTSEASNAIMRIILRDEKVYKEWLEVSKSIREYNNRHISASKTTTKNVVEHDKHTSRAKKEDVEPHFLDKTNSTHIPNDHPNVKNKEGLPHRVLSILEASNFTSAKYWYNVVKSLVYSESKEHTFVIMVSNLPPQTKSMFVAGGAIGTAIFWLFLVLYCCCCTYRVSKSIQKEFVGSNSGKSQKHEPVVVPLTIPAPSPQ